MEESKADKILEALQKAVEEDTPIGKERWGKLAFALNSLLLEEARRLYELEQNVATEKKIIVMAQKKPNVSLANVIVEATDAYRDMRIQAAKIDQIKEFGRIAKSLGDTW